MITNKRTIGTVGEQYSISHLKKHGYSIIDTNYRYKRLGEIDIIALDNKTLCFIEVKSRSSNRYGFPQQAVNFRT